MIKARDALKIAYFDDSRPINCVTIVYTEANSSVDKEILLADLPYSRTFGFEYNKVGFRDSQVVQLRFQGSVIWDKSSGFNVLKRRLGGVCLPSEQVEKLEKKDSRALDPLRDSSYLCAAVLVPEHLQRLCEIQSKKPGFRGHRFFICHRIFAEQVLQYAKNVQSAVCNEYPFLKSACYSPDMLHVTLCTICPINASQLHLALRLLERHLDYLSDLNGNLSFREPRQFKDFLVNLRVSMLMDINETLVNIFNSDGVAVDKHNFDPHVTLIKPNRAQVKQLKGRFFDWQRLKNIKERLWDVETIDGLHVCMNGSERDEEGFWLRAGKFKFNL